MFSKHLIVLAMLVLKVSIGVGQNPNLGVFLFQEENHQSVALDATNKHDLRPQITTLRFPEASESSDSLLKAVLDEATILIDFSKKIPQAAASRTSTEQMDSTYIFYTTEEDLPAEKIFYQYDAAGLLSEAITQVDDQMTSRMTYVYDETSRLEQEIKSQFDGSNWDPVLMIEYDYENTPGQANSITIFYWDWTMVDWVASFQYQLTYDDQAKLHSKRLYLIDPEGILVDLQFRQVYLYDFLDRLSDEIDEYKCLAQTDQWRQSQNLHFVYGPENRLSQKIQHSWKVDHWQQEGKKVIYTYNASGQLTEERAYDSYRSGPTVWQAMYQDSFIYTSDGQAVQLVASAWGGQQEDWVPQVITDTMKNAEGFVEEVIQYASCGGQFAPKKKELYTYDKSNQLFEILTQYWDNLIQSWAFSYRSVNTYTNDGKLSDQTFQYWDMFSQQWINNYRQILIYDDFERLNQTIYQFWLFGDWETSQTDHYVYNNDDQLIEQLIGDLWKLNYTYDTNGLRLEEIRSGQSSLNDTVEWIPQQRYSYSYNSEGQETLSEHFQFDASTSTWLPDRRTYTFFQSGTSSPLQKVYEYLYPTEMTDEIQTSALHFWSPRDLTSSQAVPETTAFDCQLANPYTNNGLIQCEDWPDFESGQLYLFDVLGRIKIKQLVSNPMRLQTGHLGAGIYSLLIERKDGTIFRQKLFLE
jgi:YD repeat-containing protein